MAAKRIEFAALGNADLVVDAIYEGGVSVNLGGVVIPKLLPGMGNMGGFRYVGNFESTPLVVLFSNGSEPNWPDELDPYQGTFRYYGDNRAAGQELHETKKKGNLILRRAFELAHGTEIERKQCPIFLIFESTGEGHSVSFRGLAVPGSRTLRHDEDLIAIWRVDKNQRFQNYRAIFTILDEAVISGDWLREIISNVKLNNPVDSSDPRVPKSLKQWWTKGSLKPLLAEPLLDVRNPADQAPHEGLEAAFVQAIRDYCVDDDFLFEAVAVKVWELAVDQPLNIDLTRKFRDGGRDAVGAISVGPKSDPIKLSFSLEAKHYDPGTGVGVKEISRLISRIKHREFGVLITTSYLSKQAYDEVRNDEHPIVVVSGRDIAEILIKRGITSVEGCKDWLSSITDPRNGPEIIQDAVS